MNKLWLYISYLGIESKEKTLYQRNLILANRINAIIFVVFLLSLIVLRIDGYLSNTPAGIASIRTLAFIALTGVNLFLARNGHHNIARVNLIFIPPLLFTIIPTLIGFVEEESYIYYPYVLIALSLIPQLVLSPKKNRVLYWSSIIVFGLLTIFIDNFLTFRLEETFLINRIIDEFYVFYKFVPISIYLFLHSSVYYLRAMNEKYEIEVKSNAKMLDSQNEELKVTIEDLKETQTKLVHAKKMAALGNLVSGVAHEINNPLNYIAGGLFHIEDLMDKYEIKNKPCDEELMDMLKQSEKMISQGIGRITRVVQLLSVFSGLDEVEQKEMDVNEIIDSTFYFTSAQTEGLISIVKNYSDCAKIRVSQDQIHKAFLHILENAIEAISLNSDRGEIRVTTQELLYNERRCVEVNIENNGPLIDDDFIDKVFEPFFTTKKETMHSGLGLTAVYAILKESNGTVEVQNTEWGVLTTLRFFDIV